MLSQPCLHELQSTWLPNITNEGLDRLIELLEKDSPLLIHGSFTLAMPQGCLATHAAWNHPQTAHLCNDAGIFWLSRVVGINPATSRVIRDWDSCSGFNFDVRNSLLEVFKCERQTRQSKQSVTNCERVELECGV